MAGVGILVSSIVSLLTPTVASFNVCSMIVLQVLAGLFEVCKNTKCFAIM